ncbi:MAG: hypothetical protein WAL41_06845 [Mycobacterium sp.]
MGRERVYWSNADRQAAYRARLTERMRLSQSGRLTGRLRGLEMALAVATRCAEDAEARATKAERDAAERDRLGRDLAAALGRVADLEATVAGLRRQLAAATTTTASPPETAGLNRAARRAAERDRRRRHQ